MSTVRALGRAALLLLLLAGPGQAQILSQPTPGLGGSGTAHGLAVWSSTRGLASLALGLTGQVPSGQTGADPAWSGAPLLTAGDGTQTYHGGGTLYWENTNLGNAADTLYISTTPYSLPAGTLATNGDRLDLEVTAVATATAATKTIICNVGYTAFDTTAGFTGGVSVISTASTNTSTTFLGQGTITRLSATTDGHIAIMLSTGSPANTGYGTGAPTWANANNIRCIAKSSVATADTITLKELRITWRPR